MSEELFDTRTARVDDPDQAAEARAWRRHLDACPDCACTARFTHSSIVTATWVDDVDGSPLGVTEHRQPMTTATFTRNTNPEENTR